MIGVVPVSDLLAARLQMALSLGFHIIFAAVGIAMPFFMAVAHHRYLRTGDKDYLVLTKSWMKGVAIFFAVGAVSGTALSFELGLLWPHFMELAGPIIGMPFSWEGGAFFLEAIALALFTYGWDKMHPRLHWFFGLMVGVTGVIAGVFILCANAWMNHPQGVVWEGTQVLSFDPYQAMFNEAALHTITHHTIASFMATGFAVAGVHALLLLKRPGHRLHQKAMRISLFFGSVAALLMPLSGHHNAQEITRLQPLKLAAAEALFETQSHAPSLVGGLVDMETETVLYAIEIPGLLSWLAFGSTDAVVEGLHSFDRAHWPPVPVVHYAFQIMLAVGGALGFLAVLAVLARFWKHAWFHRPWFLRLLALATPLGFLGIEAGWTVTEVGRQPWVIYGVMRTQDALTPMPGLVWPMLLFAAVYIFLACVVTWLMVRQVTHLHDQYPGAEK